MRTVLIKLDKILKVHDQWRDSGSKYTHFTVWMKQEHGLCIHDFDLEPDGIASHYIFEVKDANKATMFLMRL